MHTLVGFHGYIHVFEAVVAKFDYSASNMFFVYHKFGMESVVCTVFIICADTGEGGKLIDSIHSVLNPHLNSLVAQIQNESIRKSTFYSFNP